MAAEEATPSDGGNEDADSAAAWITREEERVLARVRGSLAGQRALLLARDPGGGGVGVLVSAVAGITREEERLLARVRGSLAAQTAPTAPTAGGKAAAVTARYDQ